MLMDAPLRIKSVEPAKSAFTLKVVWADGSRSRVDFTGLIHRSRHFKAFADDAAAFRRVKPIAFGTGIGWANGLDYSAATLKTLADEQHALSGDDLVAFEKKFGLNTAETAVLLHVAERTVRVYRAADALPETIAMALRSLEADSTIFAAHYRPVARRERGRPRKPVHV
jgi:hypothetical protein